MLIDLLRIGELYLAHRILTAFGIGLLCLCVLIGQSWVVPAFSGGCLIVMAVCVPIAIVWAFSVVINAVRQLR